MCQQLKRLPNVRSGTSRIDPGPLQEAAYCVAPFLWRDGAQGSAAVLRFAILRSADIAGLRRATGAAKDPIQPQQPGSLRDL